MLADSPSNMKSNRADFDSLYIRYSEIGVGLTNGLYTWGSAQHTPTQVGSEYTWNVVTGKTTATNFNFGSGCIFAINNDGSLWAKGANTLGELGTGDTQPRNVFSQIGEDYDWVSVVNSDASTLAIKADGTLWAWGYNMYGILGIEGTQGTILHTPTKVTAVDTHWKQVSIVTTSTSNLCSQAYGIDANGYLYGWGGNSYQTLGDPTITYDQYGMVTIPTRVGTDSDWKFVSAGAGIGATNFALALKTDGTLWGWGTIGYGQLGTTALSGTNITGVGVVLSPIRIGTDIWKSISCSQWMASYGVKADGTLWSSGYNIYGCLGLGNIGNVSEFTQIGSNNNWQKVISGLYCAFAIKENGTLWATGANDQYQLGDGTNINKNIFTQVDGNTNWYDVTQGAGLRY